MFLDFSDHGFYGQKCDITGLCFDCRGKGQLDHASGSSSCEYQHSTCDKHEVNKKKNVEMEELFAPWVIEKCKRLKDTEEIPHPRLERESIPQLLMPLMGSEDLQNMLKFACIWCCSALLQKLRLG